MRILILLAVVLAMSAGCRANSQENVAETIIALERGALDRWGKGDPEGYFEIYAPEVTYFDPTVEKRVDGIGAVRALIAPYTGKISVSRYDMLSPKVEHHGDLAVLSFNLLSYRPGPDGQERVVARWNSSAVYRRTGDTWKSIHVHWSYIKPELKTPVSEAAS